jgi:FkbH-like protein
MSTVSAVPSQATHDLIRAGDDWRMTGEPRRAIDAYLRATEAFECAPGALCVKLARCYLQAGGKEEAYQWALAVVDAGDDYSAWLAAAPLAIRLAEDRPPESFRITRKAAVLSSYTTTQWSPLLRLAALRLGIKLDLYLSGFGQYRSDVLDRSGGLYEFRPDIVLIVVHHADLSLPAWSEDAQADIALETARWEGLWQRLSDELRATIIQHNFASPSETPFGHLGIKLAGSRYRMVQELNLRLGQMAGRNVALVDCERLSAQFGKQRWFSPRYWHLAKMAVSPEAQPLLARHTAAVMGAQLGLTRKCLVLDLDNTLWGGVIGEDGLAGIKLGQGPEGEAFSAFQEYVLRLKERGVMLAVCSKNNEDDARLPFEKHPEMRLRLEDIALFVANWRSKPENLEVIARSLNIGLDSLVFADDNPAERRLVRQALPEVDVIPLPADPAAYVATLAEYPHFETASFTPEDAQRTSMYQARARIAAAEASAASLEEFYRSLRMTAEIGPIDEFHLPRVAQLIGKTNQFNVTTRRHGLAQVQAMIADPHCVHFYLRLKDAFVDHGLVSVIIALQTEDSLSIDTWVMSCRVIGRTVESAMLHELCGRAIEQRCRWLAGTYIPTARNLMVRDIFSRFGFEKTGESETGTVWRYDLARCGPIPNQFIEVVRCGDRKHECAREAAGNTAGAVG